MLLRFGFSDASSLTIGVAVAVNDIDTTVKAFIDDATVSAAGDVALTASESGTIDAYTFGGSVSASGASAGPSTARSARTWSTSSRPTTHPVRGRFEK